MAEIISSRTPEGLPNRCPVCDSDTCIQPSLFYGDAPCPKCGCLLWFLNLPDRNIVIEHGSAQDLRARLHDIIAEQLGVDPNKVPTNASFVHDLGADSLDAVELVMELETEFGPP